MIDRQVHPTIYVGWTIPNLEGAFGTNGTDLGHYGNGIFSSWMSGGTWGNHKGGNGFVNFNVDLERSTKFAGHTGDKLQVNHYRCKWLIKYR